MPLLALTLLGCFGRDDGDADCFSPAQSEKVLRSFDRSSERSGVDLI